MKMFQDEDYDAMKEYEFSIFSHWKEDNDGMPTSHLYEDKLYNSDELDEDYDRGIFTSHLYED